MRSYGAGMARELWEEPSGPPPRPPGIPDHPGNEEWLEWRTPAEGKYSTRMVWAWINGAWRDTGSVHAEGRNSFGWWFWVWWPTDPVWLHEAQTLPWAPTPEQSARWREIYRQPPLPRDEIIALIREEFGS